jgi:bifunctional DNA-binding transcriptional regulator/antitoxin component of YhaV-PrlF toxin-antitoxin module
MQTILFGTYQAIKAGQRGIVVHLPAKYCKTNGIEPGDRVDLFTVEGDDKYLIVQPHEEAKP